NGDSGTGEGVIVSGAGTTGNTISSNWVGVGVNDMDNRANGANGIAVKEGASGNVISYNLIGFNQTGVLLDGAMSNTVKANLIGITAAGGGIGNSAGIGLLAQHAAAKNMISGNMIGHFNNGVALEGPGVTGNLIQFNYIGVAGTGQAAPNTLG